MRDLFSNIEQSTTLNKFKLLLNFIYNLEIPELDKAEILFSVDLKLLFSQGRIPNVPLYIEKIQSFFDFLTKVKLQQFKEEESKDYFTKKLTEAIIEVTKSNYNTNIELFTLYINFILNSEFFDAETITLCLHNICDVAFNMVNEIANPMANTRAEIDKLADEIINLTDKQDNKEVKKEYERVQNTANDKSETVADVVPAMSEQLNIVYLLLEKIMTTKQLNDESKLRMVVKFKQLQGTIFKIGFSGWLRSNTKQLVAFANKTIENSATKKQLFSIIETLHYDSKRNESRFIKEYIELIQNDDNLKPEDKKSIVEILENEKLIIESPILFANAKLRTLSMQSMVYEDNNSNRNKHIPEEAKNILTRITEDDNLVEVLSFKDEECFKNKNTITDTIAVLYEAGKISIEDVRKICSLYAIINDQQLKDVLRTKLQQGPILQERIIMLMRSFYDSNDIVCQTLVEELDKVMN